MFILIRDQPDIGLTGVVFGMDLLRPVSKEGESVLGCSARTALQGRGRLDLTGNVLCLMTGGNTNLFQCTVQSVNNAVTSAPTHIRGHTHALTGKKTHAEAPTEKRLQKSHDFFLQSMSKQSNQPQTRLHTHTHTHTRQRRSSFSGSIDKLEKHHFRNK